MQLPPASVLLSWPTPNYINPTQIRGPTMLILTLIFAPLSVVVVTLRIYTRIRISRSFGADDVCILIALVPTLICAVLSLFAMQHAGWNRHVWDVPPSQLVTGLRLFMALEIAFAAGCQFTKMSMLFFIRRLVGRSQGITAKIIWALMFITTAELIVFSIVVINTCIPVSAYWTLSFGPQHCINEPAHLLAGGIINTVTDICVIILPIPVVLKLKLPRRQQIILVALFAAGFVTVFAGVARIFYTHRLNYAFDKTWWAYQLLLAGVVELYLGIIAASLPATKKFVSIYIPKLLGSNSNESYPPHTALGSNNSRNGNKDIELSES